MGSHARSVFKDRNTPVLPLDPSQVQKGSRGIAARVDGATGSGDGYRKRGKRRPTESLGLSSIQILEALVAFAGLWEQGERYDSLIPERNVGRPLCINGACVVLYEFAAAACGSLRRAEREFRDAGVWERLMRAAEVSAPLHLDRRLPSSPPSRSQFHRFRRRYLCGDDQAEEVRMLSRALAIDAARALGALDPAKGSVTRPDPANVVVGDATWLPAMYNRPPDDRLYDEHGVRTRRIDPDAVSLKPGDMVVGRHVVSVLAGTTNVNETLVLDIAIKPERGSDADMFVEMVRNLLPVADVKAAVYDMAIDAENHDDLLRMGVASISKTPRDSRGEPSTRRLGDHKFRLADGTTRHLPVAAVDGWASITLVTPDGERQVALDVTQLKVREFKKGHTWNMVCTVPDHPDVPKRFRNASTIVRLNSTDDEIARNARRTTALRAFAEGSATFDQLFGLRESTESMHHHLKSTLPNRRARCVGRVRWQLMLCAYQSLRTVTALIAWHYRTGADLSPWFGEWRPPPRHTG